MGWEVCEAPGRPVAEAPSGGRGVGPWVQLTPCNRLPLCFFPMGRAPPATHHSWCGFGQCPVLPHLNPKLHLFLLVLEDTEGPTPAAETTGHPHPPPPSQEDETASSSEGTTVSAAVETAFLYQWQDGARTSLPSLHPSPMPLQDRLGNSAWFLPHAPWLGSVWLHVCVCFALPHRDDESVTACTRTPILHDLPEGTDTASPLLPAGLLPSSEAPAACGQGQAKEGQGALQLKGHCYPTQGSLLPPASKRGSAEHPCVLCLLSCISWRTPPKVSPAREMGHLLSSVVSQEPLFSLFLVQSLPRLPHGGASAAPRGNGRDAAGWVWDSWGFGRAVGFGCSCVGLQ